MVDRVGVNVEERTAGKVCGKCRETLPLMAYAPSQIAISGAYCRACMSEYHRKHYKKKGSKRPDSITKKCAECEVPLTGLRSDARHCSPNCAQRSWRKVHPHHVRSWTLQNLYRLTHDQLLAMIEQQGGACAICGDTEPRQWCVDHCHATGQVRGVLCPSCNTGLGMFRDNTDALAAAISYLNRARTG